MNQFLTIWITGLNSIGRGFCNSAAAMFLQVGVLVAVLFAIDILLRRRLRATVRYWIWMLVFVKLLLPPSLSVPTGIGYWCGTHLDLSPAVSTPAPQVILPPSMGVVGAAGAGAEMRSMPRPDPDPVSAAAEPAEPVALSHEHLTWQAVAFLVWAAGVLVLGGLVIQRLSFVRGLIAQGQPVEGDLLDTLDQCRQRMGLRRAVGLRLSSGAFSPAVCGLLRPTIVIPAALLERLSPDSVKAVLIHELAHVKRADLWINSLQTVLQVIYFYNPLIWLAHAIVRRVREQAVDEMALVALGAEARSYGNTLIDIAEMAFLRASPALGLVGVAESRKSLEGRIRQMIARPIPKRANVGATAALAIVVVGALVLPMAAAKMEGDKSKFTANLPSGATVEFVGVCNWPASEPVCWRADGSPLDTPLYVRREGDMHPGPKEYAFVFRITGTDDIIMQWYQIEDANGWGGSWNVVDSQGKPMEGYTVSVASFKEPSAQTNLRVGLATGPWTTTSSHDGKRMNIGKEAGVLWSQAFEDGRGTYVVASAPWTRERKVRIAAIDTEGAVHLGWGGSVASGDVDQFTAYFADMKLRQIKEFQYQIRKCEIISVRGISLRPGQKTDARVETAAGGREAAPVSRAVPPSETAAPSPQGSTSNLLPNLFVFAPLPIGFNDAINPVFVKAQDWTWNKTGGDHSRESYDKVFNGTHHRTNHDVLVLIFALDQETRIPKEYEDLLPQSWAQIQEQLRQGQTVELSGKARDLNVVVLAAPRAEQLEQAVATSRFLNHPKDLLGSSGQGCDAAIEDCRVVPEEGKYRVHVSIRNLGSVASPQFVVGFQTDDPKAPRWATHGAGPLKPGEVWKEASSLFDLKEGVHTIYVSLDAANRMDELDKTNNRVLLTVLFQGGQIARQILSRITADKLQQSFVPYLVNRSVADFPPREDLSTPEAAYATMNRLRRGDLSAWQRVSIAGLAEGLAREEPKQQEWAEVLAHARIRQVMVWHKVRAAVMAELPQELTSEKIVAPIDVRYLQLENGRWLNAGNDRVSVLAEGIALFTASLPWNEEPDTRP